MIVHQTLSFRDASKLSARVLVAQGAKQSVAKCVADALVLADADGQQAHGLSRLPSYVEQIRSSKVDAKASPVVHCTESGNLEVTANGGFAYPALELAVEGLVELSATNGGIHMAAICSSHHCGVAGHPVEKLARQGFIGVMFANTPKAIHGFGQRKRAVFGTNPIAFACPRINNDPIVVDLSLSQVARGKIVEASKQKRPIPSDWGVDEFGDASTDPDAVLKGSLNAIGGAKGIALAMMVEIFAGAFVRSNFGFKASSFFDSVGEPPGVGQLILCLNPHEYNRECLEQVEDLIQELLRSEGARIPGEKRFENREKAYRNGLKYPIGLIDSFHDLVD